MILISRTNCHLSISSFFSIALYARQVKLFVLLEESMKLLKVNIRLLNELFKKLLHISFSSSKTQFYESRIFCLFTFWVLFPNESFKSISPNTQKCQKEKSTLQHLNLGKLKFGIHEIGCSMSWTCYENCKVRTFIKVLLELKLIQSNYCGMNKNVKINLLECKQPYDA